MIKHLKPQLAEAGKIKIGGLGEKRKSSTGGDFRMPVKLDHFLVTKTTRDKNGDLELDQQTMKSLLGDSSKLVEIPIVLHSDEIDEVFPTSYAAYVGRKCVCHGNGEAATRYEIKDKKRTGESSQVPCPCNRLGTKCKPHGTLHCTIRLPGSATAGSVHKWRTTSLISVQQMVGSLEEIKYRARGVLADLPLVLCLKPVSVSPDNAPASTVYVCHVEMRSADITESVRQIVETRREREKLCRELGVNPGDGYRAMLTAPGVNESPEEQSEVQQEFHPDKNEVDASKSITDVLKGK